MLAGSPTNTSSDESRSFTLRSLLLGLCAGLFIAAVSYYNDYGIKQNLFVGNHLPITVYAAFFVMLAVINPILAKFSGRRIFGPLIAALAFAAVCVFSWLLQSWLPLSLFTPAFVLVGVCSALLKVNPLRAFTRGELVVILSMTLVAGSLPTSGLMRNLPQMLVMPQHYGKANSDWQKAEPDRYVAEINPNVFPKSDDDGRVYDGYAQGLTKGKDLPPLRDTPFADWLKQGVTGIIHHLLELPLLAWAGPAKVWFPILLVGMVFIISMCRIVHRQWSEHEQLSYPIAEFANSLMKNERGRMLSDVFHNRMFWIAFGCVMLLHLINGWHVYDARMIQIPMHWDLSGIWWSKFGYFHHCVGNYWLLISGTIYLTIVAFAYFLPEEISFSLGISLPLLVLLTATMYQLGRPVNNDELTFTLFGSYVAMAAVICYTGRYYYLAIFKRALFWSSDADPSDTGVAACRWFILATIAFILLLVNLGLDWLLATTMVFIIGVMFLVLARASAETGIPFMGTPFFARGLIVAALGPAAIGPANMYLLELVTVATMQDNRECLAPYVVNALRVGSRNQVSPAPLSRAMMAVLVPALFVAGIALLWVTYSRGATNDGHMGSSVPSGFASSVAREVQKLKRTGNLEVSKTVTGLARLSSDVRDTNPSLVTFFMVGIGLVAVNAMLRLRYTWWPLHPVAFLFWNVWATNNFIWSFMIGWMIKMLVVRIGGGRTYQNLKPLFIGLIIGDLCGGMFWIVFGPLWYFWTGQQPHYYGIFPI